VRLLPGTIAAAIAAIVLAASPVARADPASDLEKAHNAYVARQYDEAESRLRALLDPKTGTLSDPDSVADARMYLAAVLIAEKKPADANAVFERLLTDKPDYQPDALRVTLEAVDAFTDAKTRMRDTLAAIQAEKVRKAQDEKARADAERQRQALRLAMLEKLAASEVIVERNSRLVALMPFGAGQLQNGQTALGWTLLVGEGLLVGGSAVGAIITAYDVAQTSSSTDYPVRDTYNQRAQTAAIVGDALAGGFVAVALAGIVHAQLTFVPERVTTKVREIPAVSIVPVVGPTGIGLIGRF
jgi:hypothetical protein